MTLAELASEYDRSLQLIKERIEELKMSPKENAVRIRYLESMARDTRETRDACRDYYKKGAYLDGRYTVRYTLQRTPGRVPKMVAGDCGNKRGVAVPRKAKPYNSDSRGIDTEATGDLAAAVCDWVFGHSSGSETECRTVNRNQNKTESAEESR